MKHNIFESYKRSFHTAEISELSKIPFQDVLTFLLQESKRRKVEMG